MISHRPINETQEKTIQKMNMLKKCDAEIQNIQQMVILVVNVLSWHNLLKVNSKHPTCCAHFVQS